MTWHCLTDYHHGSLPFTLRILILLGRWWTCIIVRVGGGLKEEEAMMQSIHHYSPFPVPQERFRTPLYRWPVIYYRGPMSSSEIFKWNASRMCGCKVLKPTLLDQWWCHHRLETCCLRASLQWFSLLTIEIFMLLCEEESVWTLDHSSDWMYWTRKVALKNYSQTYRAKVTENKSKWMKKLNFLNPTCIIIHVSAGICMSTVFQT